MRLLRKLRQKLCRHLDIDIDFEVDGRAPGWSWYCHTCGKTRELK